jgi:hypothetical protein
MKRFVLAGGVALLLGTGCAAAQTYAPPPPPAPAAPMSPPPGTLSQEREVHAVDAYGNRYDKKSTTYRDAQGVATDSTTTQTTAAPPPPPPPVTTYRSTTTTTTTAPQ